MLASSQRYASSTRAMDRARGHSRPTRGLSEKLPSCVFSNCPTSRLKYATPQRIPVNGSRQKTQTKIKAIRYSQEKKPKRLRESTENNDDRKERQLSQPRKRPNRKKRICKGLNKEIMVFVRDMLQTMLVQLKFRRSLKEMALCFLNIDKNPNDRLLAEVDPIHTRQALLLEKIAMYLVYYISRQNPLLSPQLEESLQQCIFCLLKIEQKILSLISQEPSEKILAAICSYNNYLQLAIRQMVNKRLPGINTQQTIIPQVERLLQVSQDLPFIQTVADIQDTLNWEILRIPKIPFLPPAQDEKICLVLDLDQTLAHLNETTNKFLIRPYATEFLDRLAPFFQLVLFTAATKEYADQVIEEIDTSGNFSHRLYRYHVTNTNGRFYKDLSKLGRPLNKIILVDNLASNFSMQPENGILISTWKGGADSELRCLCDFLMTIKDIEDVRGMLPKPNIK